MGRIKRYPVTYIRREIENKTCYNNPAYVL